MLKNEPLAIIDIGSNSVRLVVYSDASRSPSILFNEKVMAGLGRDLAGSGVISDEAQERALSALRRFRLLVRAMRVGRTHVVATAAVRDASNGDAFLAAVRAIGFRPKVISGGEEGELAGQGVISGIPQADGIVGDLGGGSLELVDVAGRRVLSSQSLPLGVLRLVPLMAKGDGALAKKVKKALADSELRRHARKRPFYMVGGSWRALARLDMHLLRWPLPITHEYVMSPDRLPELQKGIEAIMRSDVRDMPWMSSSRLPTLPHALALLAALVEELRPSELVVSAYGIREGLLYNALDETARARDPLIEAVRNAGRAMGRFPEHGALIDRWIAPVFDDPPEAARIRLAACLLSDVAWAAHPDFRAERGMAIALYGNWVGIDLPGRVMIAQALFSNFGGSGFADFPVARLCTPAQLQRAQQWGLAMRLAHRLSGGVAETLERSQLSFHGGRLRLTLRRGDEALCGEAVERRLKTLAQSLACGSEAIAA